MQYLKSPKILILLLLLVFTGCAGTEIASPGLLQTLLGQALSHQITQFTFAFSLAAWIHSGRVKKEIALQFTNIVTSIDRVATTLRQDLDVQSTRIGTIETGFKEIKTRVDSLEQHKGEVKT